MPFLGCLSVVSVRARKNLAVRGWIPTSTPSLVWKEHTQWYWQSTVFEHWPLTLFSADHYHAHAVQEVSVIMQTQSALVRFIIVTGQTATSPSTAFRLCHHPPRKLTFYNHLCSPSQVWFIYFIYFNKKPWFSQCIFSLFSNATTVLNSHCLIR